MNQNKAHELTRKRLTYLRSMGAEGIPVPWTGRAGEEQQILETLLEPIPMLLTCPSCGKRHVDTGEFATRPHHTHACQHCGMTWRPAVVPTVGVQFLPGFKDSE